MYPDTMEQDMYGEVIQFIRDRYATVHSAVAPVGYRRFFSRMRSQQRGAALGFRRAAEGPLFLERYLDAPVEAILAAHLGTEVARGRIVEIGSLGSNSGMALVDLWAEAAGELGSGADIAVAVLTAPLRDMFARLGIPVHQLAPAHGIRLGPELPLWGSYYDSDPVVCAGSLHEGYRHLRRFLARRRREPVT